MDAQDLTGWVGAAAFGVMGALGMVSPDAIPRLMGMVIVGPAGRSEVRAVYGGFGLATAGALLTGDAHRRAAARRAAGTALLGMAAGRVVGAAAAREVPVAAVLAAVGETVLGVALVRR